MAVLTGFEPAISGVTDRHVNPYTTAPRISEQMAEEEGFEPPWAYTQTVFKTAPL
ncbi:hypothetical protein CULT_380057 [[Clostridium] ultunense Esp]|nr:hypothetical protein CULT_380057 [[Clostridium] ultunense Esp]